MNGFFILLLAIGACAAKPVTDNDIASTTINSSPKKPEIIRKEPRQDEDGDDGDDGDDAAATGSAASAASAAGPQSVTGLLLNGLTGGLFTGLIPGEAGQQLSSVYNTVTKPINNFLEQQINGLIKAQAATATTKRSVPAKASTARPAVEIIEIDHPLQNVKNNAQIPTNAIPINSVGQSKESQYVITINQGQAPAQGVAQAPVQVLPSKSGLVQSISVSGQSLLSSGQYQPQSVPFVPKRVNQQQQQNQIINQQPNQNFVNQRPNQNFKNQQPNQNFANQQSNQNFGNQQPNQNFINQQQNLNFKNQQPNQNFVNQQPNQNFINQQQQNQNFVNQQVNQNSINPAFLNGGSNTIVHADNNNYVVIISSTTPRGINQLPVGPAAPVPVNAGEPTVGPNTTDEDEGEDNEDEDGRA